MGLASLNNLYRQVILDHAQHPRNQRLLEDYTQQVELLNPSCGDAITIRFKIVDHVIATIGFQGHGCSISMASASMMTQALQGKTREQAIQLIQQFNQLVGGVEGAKQVIDYDALGDAGLLEGVRQFPARYKCAVLAWKAMHLGLDQEIELEEGLSLTQDEQESEEME